MIWINAILQYTNRPHCQDFVFQSPHWIFSFLLMSCTTLYQHLIKEKKKVELERCPCPQDFYIYIHTHTLFLKNDLSILWSVHFSRHSKMQIGYLMITCESTRSMQSFAPSPPPTSVAIIIFLSQKIPKQTKLPVYFAVRFLWCCRSASVDRFFFFFFFCLIRSLLFRFDTF